MCEIKCDLQINCEIMIYLHFNIYKVAIQVYVAPVFMG